MKPRKIEAALKTIALNPTSKQLDQRIFSSLRASEPRGLPPSPSFAMIPFGWSGGSVIRIGLVLGCVLLTGYFVLSPRETGKNMESNIPQERSVDTDWIARSPLPSSRPVYTPGVQATPVPRDIYDRETWEVATIGMSSQSPTLQSLMGKDIGISNRERETALRTPVSLQ